MNRNELFICLIFNLLLASLFIGAFIKTARADTPYLTFVIEYWYCPLLDSNPHGRLNLIVDISKLMYDGVQLMTGIFIVTFLLVTKGYVFKRFQDV